MHQKSFQRGACCAAEVYKTVMAALPHMRLWKLQIPGVPNLKIDQGYPFPTSHRQCSTLLVSHSPGKFHLCCPDSFPVTPAYTNERPRQSVDMLQRQFTCTTPNRNDLYSTTSIWRRLVVRQQVVQQAVHSSVAKGLSGARPPTPKTRHKHRFKLQ